VTVTGLNEKKSSKDILLDIVPVILELCGSYIHSKYQNQRRGYESQVSGVDMS